jgi:hypothetical protein
LPPRGTKEPNVRPHQDLSVLELRGEEADREDMRRYVTFLAPCVALVATIVALIAASSSAASTPRVTITKAPRSVFAHQQVFFHASVSPAKDSCRLTIRDAAGSLQTAAKKEAKRGKIFWHVNVRAIPGAAVVTVSCAHGGSASTSLDVRPPRQVPVAIDNKGFTQSANLGSVSYGIAIRNELSNRDLTNVQLLVNFLDKDNVPVYPSPHPTLALLPAGSTFYYGGQVSLATVRPVVRIDVRAIAATPEPRITGAPPLISNQTLMCGVIACTAQPQTLSPFYGRSPFGMTGVAGQVLLNRSPRMMTSAVMGDVVLDPSGKIVGGGYGIAQALAFGTFESFLLPASAQVPWTSGMTQLVSAVPQFVPRQLVASALRIQPFSPRAGAPFTVSLDVFDQSINELVHATVAQCVLGGAVTHAFVSKAGRATCKITAPRPAHGQTLSGYITAMVGTDRVMKPFTVRLR